MRTGYYLVLIWLCVSSCVDKSYDIKAIQDVNTDVNFGGDHFSIPIGSFDPILLGHFIKAGDMLRITEGRYEFSYENKQTSFVPVIKPMIFEIAVIPIPSLAVDMGRLSINDIDLPNISINKPVNVAVPSWSTENSLTVSVDNITSPINIFYSYSNEIQQINHILFGDNTYSQGERLEIEVTPNYGVSLSNATTTIDHFAITFPYGFDLVADPNDPYRGTISDDGSTYTVATQTLQQDKNISFFVRQITFDPAIDQTTKGELKYKEALEYAGSFTIAGQATGLGGEVGISLHEERQLTLKDWSFNTNPFTVPVPVQSTPVKVDEKMSDPSIQNVRKVIFAQHAPIQINLDVMGLPTQVPDLTLQEYTIHFPEFMDFEDPVINASKSLVINDLIPNGGRLIKEIYLSGVSFKENPIQNNRLVISGTITSSGGISFSPASGLLSSKVQNIIIKPNVRLGTMTAGTIEAVVKPNISINPIQIKVDLAASMDFLRQSVLDLDRIALQVRIENPTGIAAQIGVNLTPYDQNNNPIANNAVAQHSGLVIKPNGISELWLSNIKTDMPDGYTFIENRDMDRLFVTLPDRVEAQLKVLADEISSVIDLTNPQPSEIQIQYALIAPISLGKNFKLLHKQRVTGLKNSLGELLRYTRNLEVMINAQNNIPLDMRLTAVGLDASGNVIPVTIGTNGDIVAGTNQGAYKASTCLLSIKETEPNALNRLDQIDLFFVGSVSPDGVGATLLDTQSIKLAMSAKIPGGVTINLNK